MYSYAGRIQARSRIPIIKKKKNSHRYTLCLHSPIKELMLQNF